MNEANIDALIREAHQLRSRAIADALSTCWNGAKRFAARLAQRKQPQQRLTGQR